MRIKNEELAKKWIYNNLKNGSNHSGSFRIKDNKVYTYNVLLAHFEKENLILNIKRYSNTSSRHRNLIKYYAELKGINIIERG